MTPRRLRKHCDNLAAFNNAYVAYLDGTLGNGSSASEDEAELRSNVLRRIPAAQAALNAAGVNPVVYPPPMAGGPGITGLANLVFIHERPGFRLSQPPLPQDLLDAVRVAAAQLEEREGALRRKRLNPLYWGDRLLRAVLGFPAYLLSLILRVPVSSIEESPWGVALRVVGLALEAFGIYFAGRAAGWWG